MNGKIIKFFIISLIAFLPVLVNSQNNSRKNKKRIKELENKKEERKQQAEESYRKAIKQHLENQSPHLCNML